jgi:hypothetical protein
VIDFDAVVLAPLAAIYDRPIWVLPLASQPGKPGYWARGDYRIANIDVADMAGNILSEQTLTMGVRRADFRVPVIGGEAGPRDQVYIPAHLSMPAAGPFWIDDTDDDAQGHSVWSLKEAPVTPQNIPPQT